MSFEKECLSLQFENNIYQITKCAMKILKFSLLFIVLLMPMGTAWGQSKVSKVPLNESDTTIVRYWKEDINIVYTCISEFQDKYFLLVDETSPR